MKTAHFVHWTNLSRSGMVGTLFWFIIHLIFYSVILTAMTVINMIVEPSHPWFLLILFGWCGLLIVHAQNVMGPCVETND